MMLNTTNKTVSVTKGIFFVLTLFFFLSACEQKAVESQKTPRLLTSTDKQIVDFQIAYVSHEYNWRPGTNMIKTRLAGNESQIANLAFDDIKEIHVKHIDFDADPRIGAKRLEVDYVNATETIKGYSFPMGAFSTQLYIILPDDFPISELEQYFKPLIGSHVNPEYKKIKDKKWLRVPLVQIQSLYK